MYLILTNNERLPQVFEFYNKKVLFIIEQENFQKTFWHKDFYIVMEMIDYTDINFNLIMDDDLMRLSEKYELIILTNLYQFIQELK